MKHLNKFIVILLNILFCIMMFLLFTRNSILRPFAGSYFKEFLSALLLIGSLYINYFLLYPKLHQNISHITYWLTVLLITIIIGVVDLAIALPNIILCNAQVIEFVGPFNFFSKTLFFIIGRNLALNFFPFLIKERQHYQQALEKEVKVVYHYVRKLDVTDKNSNIHLIDIDDIFYCLQQGNFTEIRTVQNKKYTRLGSMRHLEQLFGEEDFIRITTTVLVPFRYIKSCKDNMVTMKKMPMEKEPTTFKLEPRNQEDMTKKIIEGILRYKAIASGKNIPKKTLRPKVKRKPITPSDEKIKRVLSFIEINPNCNSADIIAGTEYSLSTVERCLFELKKQGLIRHTGSKKKGGYYMVSSQSKNDEAKSIQQKETVAEEKSTEESGILHQ